MESLTSAVTQVLGTALAIAAVAVTRHLEKRYGKLLDDDEEEDTDTGEGDNTRPEL